MDKTVETYYIVALTYTWLGASSTRYAMHGGITQNKREAAHYNDLDAATRMLTAHLTNHRALAQSGWVERHTLTTHQVLIRP